MYSTDLPSTYLPIWLSVKIPLIIILGLIILPFTEKKFSIERKYQLFWHNFNNGYFNTFNFDY